MPRAMCPHGYIGDAIERCPACGASRRSTPGGGFGESIPKKIKVPGIPTKLEPPCPECGGYLINSECQDCGWIDPGPPQSPQ